MTRPETEGLQTAPVFGQLRWRWTWRGMTAVHLGLILGPVFVFYPAVWGFKMVFGAAISLGYALLPSLVLAVFIGLGQVGRHPDALVEDIGQWLAPSRSGHLSPLIEEDDRAWPVLGERQAP